jgi:hypothetical protein
MRMKTNGSPLIVAILEGRHWEEVGLSSGPNPTWRNTQFFFFACHNCSVLFAQNSNLKFAIIDCRWHAMSQPKDEDEGTTDQNPFFSAATK